MLRDLVGLVGLIALLAGATSRFGWDIAAIIGGSTLLLLAILGTVRR